MPVARASVWITTAFTARKPNSSASMVQGERISTPKSMVMPTAMKNRPSSRPLNGSRSVSSSRRYSLSASSTPARKAPSAIDRPTASISMAVATTSSSAAAVKISGVRLRAIQRSSGRSSRRPPSTIPPTTPTIFAASSARPLAVWGCAAPPAPSRAGGQQRQQRARMGMAATSWKSRIENAFCPLSVRIRLRSASTCSAIAVDDSASPSAPTSATRHGSPQAQATAHSRAAQPSTCALPSPKIGRRRLQRRLGCSSSPTRNSISTTPNSAKCRMSCTLLTRPRPHGPMAMPAAR